MGQILHGCVATTHAVRAAIQRSQASIAELSRTYGLNPKTVVKWKKRVGVDDAPMGPKERRSSVLGKQEEALAVDQHRQPRRRRPPGDHHDLQSHAEEMPRLSHANF